jgi:hypothetical protein
MKKYTANYFDDKFKILFRRLLEKEGFVDDVKEFRKQFDIPDNGFTNSLELSEYLMNRLSKKEREETTSLSFLEQYRAEFSKPDEKETDKDDDEEMEKMIKEFDKKYKNDFVPIVVLVSFQTRIKDHSNYFTRDPLITHGKKNKDLYNQTLKIFNKFMDLSLLDPHIAFQYIERYIFLGETGVNGYIKERISCPLCRYIGVDHFSPTAQDMKGKDKGLFGGKYLFNDNTVKRISQYFDSFFLIIRPYATKEEVIQYINDNWDIMKEHTIGKDAFYKELGVNPSKIKKSDIDRNRLVYDLYKSSKKELLSHYKGEQDLSLTGIYKEEVISAILKEKYNIEMSADAIKKTATRFASSTRLKRRPKDIRDI